MMEIVFWPTMDLLVWGFLSVYLARTGTKLPAILDFLIGGLILWDLFYRAQQGITISLLEDIWSRNLINVFVTPLRLSELLVGTGLVSVFKALAATVVLAVVSFFLYRFSVWTLGLTLLAAMVNLLVLGWALGVCTSALILRYGHAAEALAWGIPFLVQPLSAVFYPLDVLPVPLRIVGALLPSTHVFEGLRAYLASGHFPPGPMALALLLNVPYVVAAALFFRRTFLHCRERGLLARLGME
jgi:ABC-2 type transport system permease protein